MNLLGAINIVTSPPPPPKIASKVKNQPLPIISTKGCKAATAIAESAQRVTLLEAAAVLELAGNMSTNKVLKVFENMYKECATNIHSQIMSKHRPREGTMSPVPLLAP